LVTILLDSSGSVKDDYETLRNLCLELVQKLKGVQVQVIQFSQTARTECSFTNDQKVLISAINKMIHMNGSTSMYDGFKLARTSLFRSITENSIPVIFFVTDGDYSGKAPMSEVNELLKLKPRPMIIGIGVGVGTSTDKLQQILPGQLVFQMNNYTQLNTVISSLILPPKEIEPSIRLEFKPTNNDLQISRDNLTIQFICEPDVPLNVLPVGTEIRFLAGEFFFTTSYTLDSIATQENPHPGEVTLKIKPRAKHYGNFPEKLWFEANIPDSPRGKYKGYMSMVLGWFAGDFIYVKNPERPINVLVWGPMGSGKTSFINSLISVFHHTQDVQRPLIAFRSDQHVTKSYSSNKISDFVDHDSLLGSVLNDRLKWVLWDPWGLTPKNFTRLNILHFLEGRVPNGTQLNDQIPVGPRHEDRKINAVVFIIPIGSCANQPMLEKLQENIKLSLEFGISPIIVVNFVNSCKSEDEIKSAYDIILQASRLAKKDIVLVDNYEHEEYRNTEKDLVYWNIMKKVMKEVEKKFQKRRYKWKRRLSNWLQGKY